MEDAVPMNIINNKFPEDVEKHQLKFYLHNVIFKDKLIELSSKDTLSTVLRDKIVLEYPTIYIAANDEQIKEKIADIGEIYGLQESDSDESSSDDSDTDDSSDESSSDDGGSDSDSDSAPEEGSLKLPPLKTSLDEERRALHKPVIEVIESTKNEV